MQLVEYYLPLIKFISQTQQSNDIEYDAYRAEIKKLLAEAELKSLDTINEIEDSNDAHFAITVWVDEMILGSVMPLRHRWRAALLQTECYQTALGGEAFFTRLDRLKVDNHAVRTVYLVCLLMGFQGEYFHRDKKELSERISDARMTLPEEWRDVKSNAQITPTSIPAGIKKTYWQIVNQYLTPVILFALWAIMMGAIGLTL